MIIVGGALLLAPGFITDVDRLRAPDPADPGRVPGGRRPPRPAPDRLRLGDRSSGAAGRVPAPDRAPAARRAGRGYDYEGTAREVDEPAPEIEPGEPP